MPDEAPVSSRTPDTPFHPPQEDAEEPLPALPSAEGRADGHEHTPDQHPREMLAAYALNALDGDERDLVFRHVQRCAVCRAEVDAYGSVVEQLAYAAEPMPVPVRARGDLLLRIDELARRGEGPLVLGDPPAPRRGRARGPALHDWPRVPRIAAWSIGPVAAAVVIVMVVVMVGIINRQQDALQAIEDEQGATREMLVAQSSPESDTTFHTTSDANGATARVLTDRAKNRVMIVAINLPQPQGEQVYVAWLQISGTPEFARVAELTVDDLGRAQTLVQPADNLANYSEISVTLEPSADTTYPTGRLMMTKPLVDPE